MEAALRLVNRRERTATELRDSLVEKGYERELASDMVAELEGIGVIDDRRYAELFAEDKRRLSGWGPERIGAELRGRGVSSAEVERVLATENREELLDRAGELLRRREPIEGDRGRANAIAYLTRRGYDYELAHEALRAVEHRTA